MVVTAVDSVAVKVAVLMRQHTPMFPPPHGRCLVGWRRFSCHTNPPRRSEWVPTSPTHSGRRARIHAEKATRVTTPWAGSGGWSGRFCADNASEPAYGGTSLRVWTPQLGTEIDFVTESSQILTCAQCLLQPKGLGTGLLMRLQTFWLTLVLSADKGFSGGRRRKP